MLDLSEIKKLYASCFPEDSPTMVELFFEEKLGVNNCFFIKEKDKIVCQLFVVDKVLSYLKRSVCLPFIVGLGTESSHRGKGLAARLMQQVLSNTTSPFIALYPFDHNFYKKMGFATVSYDYKALETTKSISSEEANKIYDKYTLDKDFFIVRSAQDYSFYRRVMDIDKVNYFGTVPIGYTNGEETVILGKEGKIEGTMVRIANLNKALELSKITLPPIKIVDKFIANNNVTISVQKGKMIPCANYQSEIDIEKLCLILFGKAENMPFAVPKYTGHLLDKY